MFTMKDLGHTLPGQIFLSVKIKHLQATVDVIIAPDKAAYCVFTQFRGPENAIKFISVRTKTQ